MYVVGEQGIRNQNCPVEEQFFVLGRMGTDGLQKALKLKPPDSGLKSLLRYS
jgi:hypothetical protein